MTKGSPSSWSLSPGLHVLEVDDDEGLSIELELESVSEL
jgi:hypothetical protein